MFCCLSLLGVTWHRRDMCGCAHACFFLFCSGAGALLLFCSSALLLFCSGGVKGIVDGTGDRDEMIALLAEKKRGKGKKRPRLTAESLPTGYHALSLVTNSFGGHPTLRPVACLLRVCVFFGLVLQHDNVPPNCQTGGCADKWLLPWLTITRHPSCVHTIAACLGRSTVHPPNLAAQLPATQCFITFLRIQILSN